MMYSARAVGTLVGIVAILVLIFGFAFLTQPANPPESNYVGALWLAASNGLLKLKATDASIIFKVNDVKEIQSVAVDDWNSKVWVYGQGRLYAYGFDGKQLLSIPIPASNHEKLKCLEKPSEVALAADPTDGGVWVGGQRALYRLGANGEWQVSLELRYPLAALALDGLRSILWVGTDKTLTAYDQQGEQVMSIPLGKHTEVRDIAFDAASDESYIAFKDSLVRYDAEGHPLSQIKLEKIERVAAGGGCGVWAATENRLARIDASDQILFRIEPFEKMGHADIIDVVTDPADCSAWVMSDRHLCRVTPTGEVINVTELGLGRSGNLFSLAFYRDMMVPKLWITSPSEGSCINDARPLIKLSYSDVGSGVDNDSLQVAAKGKAVEATCQFSDKDATCSLSNPLPDGLNTLSATVCDHEGNKSRPFKLSFTVDTIPPQLILLSPSDGLVTNTPSQTLTGSSSEPAALTINGDKVRFDQGYNFTHHVNLVEGLNTFKFEAADSAGNNSQLTVRMTLDTLPPAPATMGKIGIGQEKDEEVSITGDVGSIEGGAQVSVTNLSNGRTEIVTARADGSFWVKISARAGDLLSLMVLDVAGNQSEAVSVAVPKPVSPAAENIPEGSFGETYRDLVPLDATLAEYAPKRFSLVTGSVTDSSDAPLEGATIYIHRHPEYGTVRTNAGGRFTIPVEGGGDLTAVYEKQGFITSHRQVHVPWNDIAVAETIRMISRDPVSTTFSLDGNANTVVTHRSTMVADSFGARSATMVFTGDNRAYSVDANGDVIEELTTISVRATEFPTPESMPAKLPPTSAFTYCAELTVDGAERVRFEKPVTLWVDNFLGFPVGMAVPVGYYDRDRDSWVPIENGRVVKLLDTDSDGIVDALDADGDGQPDDLNENGSFTDEVKGLQDPRKYPPGTVYWRVELHHFSPLDCNWAFYISRDAVQPNPGTWPQSDEQEAKDEDCYNEVNSFISHRSRIFHEDIPVPGTGLSLHYASNRVRGYGHLIRVPASGGVVPASLKRIVVRMDVAGRTFEQTRAPLPDQVAEFLWDGLDHLGKQSASALALIRVGFVYDTVYTVPPALIEGFASPGVEVTSVGTRQELTLWEDNLLAIKPWRNGGTYSLAEGWSLSNHHQLDPLRRSLQKGDGKVLKTLDSDYKSRAVFYSGIIETVAGNGNGGYGGEGGQATQTSLNNPEGLFVAPNGDLYIADTGNCRIRKVSSSGIITSVAGNGGCGFGGDGGAAIEAQLFYPNYVAGDSMGNLYISDAHNHRIRKVDPSGIITTVAGSGLCPPVVTHRSNHPMPVVGCVAVEEFPCYAGDEGPATEAKLNFPTGIALDGYGNLFIADTGNNRVRKVDSAGLITTVAGNGSWNSGGDGGPALQTPLVPYGVCADSKGSLYVSDNSGESGRIRKIDPSGTLTTVAGNGVFGLGGEGVPATEVSIGRTIGLTTDRKGNLYFADRSNSLIRVVDNRGIISTLAGLGGSQEIGDGGLAIRAGLYGPSDIAVDPEGNFFIAESDGNRIRKVGPRSLSMWLDRIDAWVYLDDNGLGYVMTVSGLHEKTVELDTGAVVYWFGYDGRDYLASITDRSGNRVGIQRDAAGVPTAMVSPDGLTTALSVDAGKHLKAITYPDGNTYRFEYTAGGLMTAEIEPMGNRFEHVFDAAGKLTDVADEEGGRWQYSSHMDEIGRVRTDVVTGEGNRTFYVDQTGSDGSFTSTITNPTGAQTLYIRSADGLHVSKSLACGLHLELDYDLDPEYHFQYTRQLQESTPSGLERVTLRSRSYQDTDADQIFDLITEAVTVDEKTTTLTHEILQNRKILTSPEGRTITVSYDPETLLTTSIRVPGLYARSYGYDARGRLTSTKSAGRESALSYDQQGHLSSTVDPENSVTTYNYDAVGRLSSIERVDGSSLRFNYDKNGNMTVLTAPSDVKHQFGYNRANINTSYVTPLSGSYQYAYDRDRRLTQILFPSGKEIRNIYDKTRLGRIETPEGNIELGYLCGAKVGSIEKGNEAISYDYDGNLLLAETFSGTLGESVRFSYSSDFKLSRLAYADTSMNFVYDNDGLVIQSGTFSISRNAENGLAEAVADQRMGLVRTYNGYGELSRQEFKVGETSLYSWDLDRSSSGRIISKTEMMGGLPSVCTYTYDSLGRLLMVKEADLIIEEYRYGPNGTRTFERNSLRGIDSRTMTYSGEDHLLTAGSVTYQYDADGFLTAKTLGSQTTNYSYSSRGELLGVTLPGGKLVEYVYDPLGRRIARKINGNIVEKYLWQGFTRLLAVYNGNDNLLMRFRYADGRMPVIMTRDGTDYYLVYDQVGSLRLVADADGNVIKRMDYDSFGNLLGDSNPAFSVPFGFAGGLYDPDTGLVHFSFRDYDPDTGRWTAKDPIGFVGGDTNLYGYVLNDPISYSDPIGLIHYNAPPPRTVPVEGQTLQSLQCVEQCLKGTTNNPNLDLLVTGGAEQSGHSRSSHHYIGQACDIAGPEFNQVDNNNVLDCAANCGFGAGQFESFPDNPNRDHWHLQLTPGNGVPAIPTLIQP